MVQLDLWKTYDHVNLFVVSRLMYIMVFGPPMSHLKFLL